MGSVAASTWVRALVGLILIALVTTIVVKKSEA